MLLEDESTWPADVLHFIEQRRELFDDWEGPASEARDRNRKPGEVSRGPRFPAKAYDKAIYGLCSKLRQHTLGPGFHCTRLTDDEIEKILQSGMQLQNAASLRNRIQALQTAGLIDMRSASAFSASNSADDSNRAGLIWFCFFQPHLAGESGISGLLRHWGGEALYRWHERDASRCTLLQRLGTPCIVVADIRISCLSKNSSLSTKLVRRYFQNRGGDIREEVDHEDYTKSPVPTDAIRRIVRFPEPEFIQLTRCDTWRENL